MITVPGGESAVAVRGDELVVEREDHGGGPVAQVQLGEDMVDVGLDRALADEQSAAISAFVLP